MQIDDLLKSWSELQPDHCRYRNERFTFLLSGGWRLFYGTPDSKAILLMAVLEAINSNPELRTRLENDGRNLCYATLMQAATLAQFSATNSDPTVALLSVYIEWLKFDKAGDEPIGGES